MLELGAAELEVEMPELELGLLAGLTFALTEVRELSKLVLGDGGL